jgi:hypothetical protein
MTAAKKINHKTKVTKATNRGVDKIRMPGLGNCRATARFPEGVATRSTAPQPAQASACGDVAGWWRVTHRMGPGGLSVVTELNVLTTLGAIQGARWVLTCSAHVELAF